MKTIRLTTPQHVRVDQTMTEYSVAAISGIRSVTGDDNRQGTHFWVTGSFKRQFCLESANQLRRMIDDALNSEDVQLGAEAVSLLARGVQTADGVIRFVEDDGSIGVVISGHTPASFLGRERSRYEHARDELLRQGFIVPKGDGVFHITRRGYVVGDLLAKVPSDGPYRGDIRLPARPVGGEAVAAVTYSQTTYNQERSVNINQTNNNLGDVNNAISDKGSVAQAAGASRIGDVTSADSAKGNVVQTSGTGNRVQVDRPKDGLLAVLWKRIKAWWPGHTG